MHKIITKNLKNAWSANSFAAEEVDFYAQKLTTEEARNGLRGLSLILLLMFGAESILFSQSGLGNSAVYTCVLLALLCVHILLSVRAIHETRTLYLLGTTLLIISGTAFVLLAHNAGSFNSALFASVTLLFMVVPLVPWGLREATVVLFLIYGTFTLSTWGANHNFDAQTLWSLQFIMLGAGTISMALVIRNTTVRKADIHTRFDLEQANKKMMQLSNRDPLTGAWNRRFLNNEFSRKTADWHAAGETYHFAFMDLDDFKPINDTCGHEYGDKVLRCVSLNFKEALEEQGYVIRMGGDEFALLFTGDEPEDTIRKAHAAVQTTLRPPAHCKKMAVGMSIGVTSVPPGIRVSQDEIYRVADIALYRAKERKELFTEGINIVRRVMEAARQQQDSVA